MKCFLIVVLVFEITLTKAQELKPLNSSVGIPPGQAVFYGNFIQRLGFSSGGFPQYIRLLNIETKELLSFKVKKIYTSFKENTFCYILKPGTYEIINYSWTQSVLYGGETSNEPIFKNIDSTDSLESKIESGKLKQTELVRFTFSITANSLNYSGTWHFDKGLVSFTNDKEQCDKKIKERYTTLDVSSAKIVLPN